jgi:hypothetical protein
LIAKQTGNAAQANEDLAALAFIGDFERARNTEFFFLN